MASIDLVLVALIVLALWRYVSEVRFVMARLLVESENVGRPRQRRCEYPKGSSGSLSSLINSPELSSCSPCLLARADAPEALVASRNHCISRWWRVTAGLLVELEQVGRHRQLGCE